MTSAAERRAREKEARRSQILDTAEKVFFDKGFDHATVDEIADQAEVSKGLVYVYFANKHELYMAMTLRGLELLWSRMSEAAQGDDIALRRFRGVGEAYITFSLSSPGYFQAIAEFGSAEMERSEPGTYEEACSQKLMAILDLMVDLVREGQKDHTMRSDLPPRALAISAWSSTHGLIQMAAKRGRAMKDHYGIDLDELHEVFFQLMGGALLPETANLEFPDDPEERTDL